MSRINNDIGELQRIAAETALGWFGNLLFLAGTIGMLAWLDLRLFVVAVMTAPPAIWALIYYQRRVEERVRVVRERSADIGSFLIDTIQGMRLVVSANAQVLRFVDTAVDALAEAREEIDALNVYPVPDGDTGTNMYLTVAAARDAFRDAVREGSGDGDLLVGLAGLRRGALLGARGNSGVILSQMLGAVATTIAGATAEERNASIMARALREGWPPVRWARCIS